MKTPEEIRGFFVETTPGYYEDFIKTEYSKLFGDPFVPKCIGLTLTNSLLFNDNKQMMVNEIDSFWVSTSSSVYTNHNTGTSHKLIKITWDELDVGDLFLDDIERIDILNAYCYKISKTDIVWIESDKSVMRGNLGTDNQLYKVVKL